MNISSSQSQFANDDERHRNSEEFVTVQSCIDGLRGKEVFVLATANETRCLPDSLTRAGRFDRVIEVEAPEGRGAERIIEHYLEVKRLSFDLDAGAQSDLGRAYSMVRDLHEDLCYGGLSLYADHRASEKQQERVEIATAASVEDFYRKAKEILCKNRGFLGKVAEALAAKDALLAKDFAAIREGCEVVGVAM